MELNEASQAQDQVALKVEELRARPHLLYKGLQQALHGKKLCIWYMGVQDLGWPIADTSMMSMP